MTLAEQFNEAVDAMKNAYSELEEIESRAGRMALCQAEGLPLVLGSKLRQEHAEKKAEYTNKNREASRLRVLIWGK